MLSKKEKIKMAKQTSKPKKATSKKVAKITKSVILPHVCPSCNPKQFAQAKGVERRRLWNIPVDSDIKL